MKGIVYLAAGLLFGLGLSLSGMIDPIKIKSFLAVGQADWNPALLFVLGSAVPVYGAAFIFLRKRSRTLLGLAFRHPQPRPIDRRLVLGAVLFGAGWGIAGICPGPAIVHLAFLDAGFALFIVFMLVGFEVQRRFT